MGLLQTAAAASASPATATTPTFSEGGSSSEPQQLTAIQRRRLQDRKEWDAWWKIYDIETQGTTFRYRYWGHRIFDSIPTFFREKIVEPLRDRYRLPYYHRKITRAPGIDECGVMDLACYYEANEQFRLDKMVDGNILAILRHRLNRCVEYHNPNFQPCVNVIEDVEENELNFFIKYGELGSESDVTDTYMKQKHRMIWERRHPEVMAERERVYRDHKERLARGDFDYAFWKKGMWYQDKKQVEPPYDSFPSKASIEGDKPLSKDWQYYKKLKQDPEFDKTQGKTSTPRLFY